MTAGFSASMLLIWGTAAQSVDPNEILQYLSWGGYAVVALGYTAMVFWGHKIINFYESLRYSRSGEIYVPADSPDPADEIAAPVSRIILIHSSFLLILICCVWLLYSALPYLPNWMTDTLGRSHTSAADLLVLLLFGALVHIERKRLYPSSE